jgi:isopenicillin N synthase-like dioxygenase
MGKYAAEVKNVALQLMEAILEGLGLGREYLNEKFQEGSHLLSVNCYPKASQGDTTIGLAPHSDYGFLAILLTSCSTAMLINPHKLAFSSMSYCTYTKLEEYSFRHG